jgi:hypothetical protein
MRVQHVWAKTGTSPVAFHDTTGDGALCPAQESVQIGCSAKIKGLNAVISNGPGRLWHRPFPRAAGPPYSLAARRPAARGCGTTVLSPPDLPRPRGPRGERLVFLRRLRRLWLLGSCRRAPGGRRAGPAWAGAMIVLRWGLRFSAAGVIVCRWGRYTTQKAHNDPYVRSCLLSMVTVRTLTPMPPSPSATSSKRTMVSERVPASTPNGGVSRQVRSLSATPATPSRACRLRQRHR